MARYLIELEAKPLGTDPTGTRRLRLAIKLLLRRFGLRAVKVEPEQTKRETLQKA